MNILDRSRLQNLYAAVKAARKKLEAGSELTKSVDYVLEKIMKEIASIGKLYLPKEEDDPNE